MADALRPPPSAADLAGIAPETHTVRAGDRLARIWFADAGYPTDFALFRRFGPTASRFDHHLGNAFGHPADSPDRSILYVVPQTPNAFLTALGEVFQADRMIDRSARAPMLSVFRVMRDIRLLDLTGYFTTRIKASATLSSGPRTMTKRWSRVFHEAYPDIEGIRYRSSMSGGRDIALALFERCEDAMPAEADLSLPLAHSCLANDIEVAARVLRYDVKI